ncbi:MAG TPA: phosphotransferase, partial [Actinomycetales bacterium]|nr:phosphotransferase [Actinomycetales bacterium]
MAQNPSLQLAALATAAVRGLDVVATRPPQHATTDYRYCGLLDARGRHWIAQAALHPAASTALDAELPILGQLDIALREDRIGFDVIRPEGTAELPTGHRLVVYRELPGRALDLSTLHAGPGPAAELGRAIAEIHELPAALLDEAHAPIYDADSYRRRRLAELDDAARTSRVPPILLARWERALEDVALWHFQAVPVHGDLAAENVYISNGTISAILNWSNAHVGDPAEDLAWLYAAAPDDCLDTLDEAYAMGRSTHPDEHLGARATLYSELAVARWLLHGVRLEDAEIIADAEVMLHALARQVADAGPI